MASLKVLGGSKIYVFTQRTQIRDFYDIFVLIKKGHENLYDMLQQANFLSRNVTIKKVSHIFDKVHFDDNDMRLLNELQPEYSTTAKELNDFFHQLSHQIKNEPNSKP